jgi:phage terminase Nu1 subunit (DNA packaging protein)
MLGKLMDTSNKNTHPETNWLTEKEVAAMLNITSSTLQNWRWRGVGIQYSRFMRSVRYRESDILKYMADSLVEVEQFAT